MSTTEFNGFPIVNDDEKLVGLINRNYLHVLIKHKCFSDPSPKTSLDIDISATGGHASPHANRKRSNPKSNTSINEGGEGTGSQDGKNDISPNDRNMRRGYYNFNDSQDTEMSSRQEVP